MLETCRAGPGPVSLSVEKTIKFDHPGPVGQNDQIFDGPIFPLFDAP